MSVSTALGIEFRPSSHTMQIRRESLGRQLSELLPREGPLGGLLADRQRPVLECDFGGRPGRQDREVIHQVLPGRKPVAARSTPALETACGCHTEDATDRCSRPNLGSSMREAMFVILRFRSAIQCVGTA